DLFAEDRLGPRRQAPTAQLDRIGEAGEPVVEPLLLPRTALLELAASVLGGSVEVDGRGADVTLGLRVRLEERAQLGAERRLLGGVGRDGAGRVVSCSLGHANDPRALRSGARRVAPTEKRRTR